MKIILQIQPRKLIMQVNAHKIFIVILIAMNFQACIASKTRKLRIYQKSKTEQIHNEINPIPAFIKKYREEHPCIGAFCCSANPEHHQDIHLSIRGSSYYACYMCQVRPVDVYNSQQFKWDGTCLDTTQSCLNVITYPKGYTTIPLFTGCCFLPWYYNYFKPNHPAEYAWDNNHDIDWENRKIIKTPYTPQSEQMKRD